LVLWVPRSWRQQNRSTVSILQLFSRLSITEDLAAAQGRLRLGAVVIGVGSAEV
jgi:hypothetical protein